MNQAAEQSGRAFDASIGLGTAYGAVCGAACAGLLALYHLYRVAGTSSIHPESAPPPQALLWPLLTPIPGAVIGSLLGMIGGCAAGTAGVLIGRPLGWSVAAVVGAAAASLGAMTPWILMDGWPPPANPVLLAPIPIGGVLGLALRQALRTGRSPVPGVQRLAAILHESGLAAEPARSPDAPTEVTPARGPAGRGDEAAPVGRDPALEIPVCTREVRRCGLTLPNPRRRVS